MPSKQERLAMPDELFPLDDDDNGDGGPPSPPPPDDDDVSGVEPPPPSPPDPEGRAEAGGGGGGPERGKAGPGRDDDGGALPQPPAAPPGYQHFQAPPPPHPNYQHPPPLPGQAHGLNPPPQHPGQQQQQQPPPPPHMMGGAPPHPHPGMYGGPPAPPGQPQPQSQPQLQPPPPPQPPHHHHPGHAQQHSFAPPPQPQPPHPHDPHAPLAHVQLQPVPPDPFAAAAAAAAASAAGGAPLGVAAAAVVGVAEGGDPTEPEGRGGGRGRKRGRASSVGGGEGRDSEGEGEGGGAGEAVAGVGGGESGEVGAEGGRVLCEGAGEEEGEGEDGPSSSKAKSRRKRSRFRKMSPALARVYSNRDAALREKSYAQSELAEARRELAEAQKRVDAALALDRSCDELVHAAEEAVVDAELEEPGVWNTMYRKLREWREEHGNCWVPKRKNEMDKDVKKLGTWVSAQRVDYLRPKEQGKSLKNKPYQIKALERLGFSWNQYEASWDARYEELLAYRAEHGDTNVPYNYEKAPSLRQWLQVQRTQYKYLQDGKHSVITPERIKLLEDAGVVWKVMQDNWNRRYEDLLKFREEHGHLKIPKSKKDNRHQHLATWLWKQQIMYKDRSEGKRTPLTDERAAKLEALGLVKDPATAKWELRLRETREFREKFGHGVIPAAYAENRALGRWAGQLREAKAQLDAGRRTKLADRMLTDERLRELEEAGFSFDEPPATKWELRFDALRAFHRRHGHCDVPDMYEDDPRLPAWVRAQRRDYEKHIKGKKGSKITAEQVDMLADIDFDFQYGD